MDHDLPISEDVLDNGLDHGLEANAPAFTLHPVKGVVWAAFWGTFIAAGIVMAINYARTDRKSEAFATVALSVVATAVLFGIVFAIPDTLPIPNFVFWVPQLLAVYFVAKALQGQTVEDHADRGGKVASSWPSVGIGLLCLPVVFAAVFGVILLTEPSYGTDIAFGNDEIYIAGEATEADAQKLADVLEEAGFFGSNGVSVRLETVAGQSTVSFVLIKDAWNDPENVAAFRGLGTTLTESGFPKPLTIELCNDYFEAQKTLTIE